MRRDLSSDDIQIILEALNYSKRNFESYIYPFAGTKQDRVTKVENIIAKLRYMREDRDN